MKSWLFKSNCNLNREAFRKECCHSFALWWFKFVEVIPYIVPAFHVWTLTHCYQRLQEQLFAADRFVCMTLSGLEGGCLDRLMCLGAVGEIFMK